VRLWEGKIGDAKERLIAEATLGAEYESVLTLAHESSAAGYIRAEVCTSAANPFSGRSHVALSNPIWFEP
jgi:hypothetical protein